MTMHSKHFLDRDFAFRSGQKAFRAGASQNSNPYATGGTSLALAAANAAKSIAHHAWNDGYIWQSHGCPDNVSPDFLIRIADKLR
jgi:hypothetical protein